MDFLDGVPSHPLYSPFIYATISLRSIFMPASLSKNKYMNAAKTQYYCTAFLAQAFLKESTDPGEFQCNWLSGPGSLNQARPESMVQVR
jgi:hypothetical protein